MNDRERIGKRIAQLRMEAGISQYKLAELTGLAPGNIARIETGKYSTGIDILSKIGDALGYQLDFIEITLKTNIMARTTDYKLKGEKIKAQIDELVTALLEERKNSFDENRKVKIANIDLEELNNIELQQLQVRISKILVERTK